MPRSADFITATGIGVSDLERAARFYETALGMKRTMSFKLDHMDEIVLAHEGRNAIVLMHWTDGSKPNYRDLPVKLVFYVTDPKAVAERIKAAGGSMTREPAPIETMNGTVIGLGKDLDGYVVELIEAPAAAAANAA